jgi:hypothetical protein
MVLCCSQVLEGFEDEVSVEDAEMQSRLSDALHVIEHVVELFGVGQVNRAAPA